MLLTAKPGIEGPKVMTITDSQLGEKWGKHNTDYPSLRNWTEYKQMAVDIFANPERVIYDSKYSEFYYIRGNDLLRTNQFGEFISLYPGSGSDRVINAIISAAKIAGR